MSLSPASDSFTSSGSLAGDDVLQTDSTEIMRGDVAVPVVSGMLKKIYHHEKPMGAIGLATRYR